MNILYYFWNENSKDDCVECLKKMGHNVKIWERKFKNYSSDSDFSEALILEIRKFSADCVFSFDYFPLLSLGALECKIPYISWVYDCPHYTLESETLSNKCNHVFLFDFALYDTYRTQGFETVYYMPLPVNIQRLKKFGSKRIGNGHQEYRHDISFVGSLYNDEHNYFDKINVLPDYLKGYLDSVISVQEKIYGMDIIGELISDDMCNQISKYVKASLGEGFRDARNTIIRDMIRKKVTVNERKNLLSALGNNYKVTLYSGGRIPQDLKVEYRGTVDYLTEMPIVFLESKINLNITLRSILSGIPLRVIDILGAGGFCLTNYQIELEEYFENGKELVWFDSQEDILDKAEYYLKHDSEREKIALNGNRAVEEKFSYEVLLPKIMKCI